MNLWDFVDLSTRAKQCGVTEKMLTANILSGKVACYVHAANLKASADPKQPLPPWTEESFPIIEWKELGIRQPTHDFIPRSEWRPLLRPSYFVNGWLLLDHYSAQQVLSRRMKWTDVTVHVVDSNGLRISELELVVDSDEEWVTANSGEYVDGGYYRHVVPLIAPDDLFFRSEDPAVESKLSSRKESSYLGIIAAMRGLLRDQDGGKFPSEAKIIDQLVNRFGDIDGISKRNLEGVFSHASRIIADRVKTK